MEIIPNDFKDLTAQQMEQMAKLGHMVYTIYQKHFIDWSKNINSTECKFDEEALKRFVDKLSSLKIKL